MQLEVDQAVLWEAIRTNSVGLERLLALSGKISVTADFWDDSLADLLEHPIITMLKLGRQMVQSDHPQPLAQAVTLALRAKKTIVAVGIETQDQAAALVALGCHY
ncbi:MAG: hypothetical protein DCF15_15725, partial [Phormidesmis priestleyi]